MSTMSSLNHESTTSNNKSQHLGTPITSFYSNKSIFITGATGFIGKVLVEKLMYECPDIRSIYILIRSKNGHSPKQRLEDFIASDFFKMCGRVSQELLRKKLIAVVGDITVPQFGMSNEDRQTLIDNVNIVFHSAASVKFDDPLKECLNFNVVGTKSVLDLCKEVKNLDSFVHVSTAYGFCQLDKVEETIYPMKVTPEDMLRAACWMDKDALASVIPTVFEGRPNTYTFSKALAEHYIKDNKGDLPVAIARPSIVTATVKEPVAGWVDSYNGPGGVSLLGSLGIARTMVFKPKNTADLIPVDIVANSLIVIAWHTAKAECSKLRVYNITSGNHNPISWQKYLEYGREMAIEKPSMRVVRPPARVMTGDGVSHLNNFATKWISEVFFAYFVDFILVLLGKKPLMVKVVKKMHHAFNLLSYFVRREWSFPCDNLLQLIDTHLSDEDKEKFYCDVRLINWQTYIHECYMGFRRYLMKEPDSNIPQAKKRLQWVTRGYLVLQITFFVLLFLIIYSIYSCLL